MHMQLLYSSVKPFFSWVVSGIRKFPLAVVLGSTGSQFSSRPYATKCKHNYGHYTTRCISVLIDSVQTAHELRQFLYMGTYRHRSLFT